MISSIKIKGFRGFAEEQELKLSKPNGEKGSGLTVIVGPNNGGKSTIIESFKVMSSGNHISFAEGQRNKAAGYAVEIVLSFDDGSIHSLETILAGGHKAKRNPWLEGKNYDPYNPSITVLSSRRYFNPYSKEASRGKGILLAARPDYITLGARGQPIDADDNKLFKIIESPEHSAEFNNFLEQVLGYELKWTIDLSNTREYYVKINNTHDSDGLGEGLVSLLFIVAALLNSSPDKLLVIDEPELSLHPQLQRNLLDIILEKSKESQIVYATHSPELVSIDAIINGGTLARVVNPGNGSKIYQLNEESRDCLRKFEGDLFNPHIFGYDARSCFFEDDKLVVVEGQEDVIFLRKALKDLGISKKIRFFGFGAGGADKIIRIVTILKNLGFEKVCCLYDGDKKSEKEKVESDFPKYKFEILNADDIRDKDCRYYNTCKNLIDGYECKNCHPKKGIFDNENRIKEEYESDFKSLLNKIADFWIEE
ncbi:ATP-dependent nuclease [Methanosarcina sp. UBA411]|jgi:predicted ATP-dependent endonuclease of OLD family|uniref:ATP-dependent nuclease n=1 Tax=Methanosarcina sp. UBA411 TaxID=1915589 RepID=UPI0025E5C1CE|nr:AAA family ATPase [Methanosarcina sp. UBA411]